MREEDCEIGIKDRGVETDLPLEKERGAARGIKEHRLQVVEPSGGLATQAEERGCRRIE